MPGCLAELVGRWLTTIGIDPDLITDDKEAQDSFKLQAEQKKEHVETAHMTETEEAIEAVEADKSTNYVLGLCFKLCLCLTCPLMNRILFRVSNCVLFFFQSC